MPSLDAVAARGTKRKASRLRGNKGALVVLWVHVGVNNKHTHKGSPRGMRSEMDAWPIGRGGMVSRCGAVLGGAARAEIGKCGGLSGAGASTLNTHNSQNLF